MQTSGAPISCKKKLSIFNNLHEQLHEKRILLTFANELYDLLISIVTLHITFIDLIFIYFMISIRLQLLSSVLRSYRWWVDLSTTKHNTEYQVDPLPANQIVN